MLHRGTKPRLLFVSHCLPYPPHSGVTKRTYNILKQLSKSFRISLIAFSRRNHQPDLASLQEAVDELSRHTDFLPPPSRIPSEWSRITWVWAHMCTLLGSEAYTYHLYASDGFSGSLRSALQAPQPDIIHLDSIDLYRWVQLLPKVPIVCTHHNIESDLLRLRAQRLSSWPARRYLTMQAARVEKVERSMSRRFSLNVTVSDVDAERLRSLSPGAETAVIPNGVDTSLIVPRPDISARSGRLLFIGPTYSLPNADAVDFFLRHAWPRILGKRADVTFQIIGDCPLRLRKRYERFERVEVVGAVPDFRPYMAKASCCLVPMRIGGGTRLKILDAWAMGKPVVSTPIGCQGLDAIDGQNILIRDGGLAFADAVIEVVRDSRFADRLGKNGRRTVERKYDWDDLGERIRDIYGAVLADSSF